MKIRKKGYWLLFILTIVFTLAALSTVIPSESASKLCMIGYKAHCTYTPISTIICIIPAGVTCFIRKRFFVSYK
ncbi:MAG: hypothetical protein K8R31_09375 [Bacteroidales bacterium]|nr:hypothetical protein [Bacteroidales bacterium]